MSATIVVKLLTHLVNESTLKDLDDINNHFVNKLKWPQKMLAVQQDKLKVMKQKMALIQNFLIC